ncbi:MAG TPA: ABC transporter ATP-binding protein [Candidatus Merdivicinus intestinavium]|nr:ABC transporter ATP-binding protein [Candidatus Merdivicinus intestinavium]
MEQTQAIIKTEGLCRTFSSSAGEVQALRDVTLEVRPRCLSLLNGKSGSGKTTLINLLGSLDRPTSGRIFFEGQELTALPERARDKLRRTRIGFVFQSVALMGSMTAYENVEFGLRVAGFPAAGRRERALECLDYVGLSKRAGHLPQEMSGGEQQRVAIARAIAHRPAVIFADEPTAQLDSTMGLQVIAVFKKLIEEQGATIVMTTHDPDLMQLADQVFTLEDGILTGGTEGGTAQ